MGASLRYGVDRFVEARSHAVFPLSIFVINISGCLVFGLVTGALVDRHTAPDWLRVGIVVGLVGGYTTFSTFAGDILGLADSRKLFVAAAYIAASVFLGVLAVYAGERLGHSI